MKRSDMLHLIQIHLSNAVNDSIEGSYVGDKLAAERLLDQIELSGMRPPIGTWGQQWDLENEYPVNRKVL